MLIQNLFLTFAITRTHQASQRCSNERVVFFNMARPFNKHYSSPRISQYFDLQIKPFESWLTIITLTRNACCHHARVWNKRNTIRAMIPNTMLRPWITLPTDSLRIYFNLCIIKYFVDVISQNNHMKKNLLDLLAQFPNIDIQAMGFPSNWEQEPIWQN